MMETVMAPQDWDPYTSVEEQACALLYGTVGEQEGEGEVEEEKEDMKKKN